MGRKLKYLVVAVALISGLAGADQVAAGEPRLLNVSAAIAAGNDEKSDREVNAFVERIQLGRNYRAERAGNCFWDEVPKRSSEENQVNVLKLRFGNRLELLAFMLEPENHNVALAARAPALFQENPWFALNASPGDSQWPENAPHDLVAQFAQALENRLEFKGTYQLVLQPWKQEEQLGIEDIMLGGQMGVENMMLPDSAVPSLSTKDGDLTKIYPLAAAAMYAENFQASTKAQEAVITLSFKMSEMDCAVKAVLTRGNQTVYELERYAIQYEKLYDTLRALFLNVIEWQGSVVDFFNPGQVGFQPLAIVKMDNRGLAAIAPTKTLLAGKDDVGFMAFEPATGNLPWKKNFEKKESGVSRNGQLFLRRDPRLTRISPVSGEIEFVVMTNNLMHMDVAGDFLVDGLYRELRFSDKGKTQWVHVLPASILAGPLLADASVVVGDARGDLRCFSLQGQELWKVTLPRSVRGTIYAVSGLFFSVDDYGMMYVVDSQGKLLWQTEIGDVMTGAPQVADGVVVVGSKAGKLFLLDKNTGKRLKNHPFKSWLIGCHVVGEKILCMTLDKRLHIFDLASFEEEKTLRFPFKFQPEVISIKDFPLRRRPGELESVKVTGCLLTDVKGNVYVIPAKLGY